MSNNVKKTVSPVNEEMRTPSCISWSPQVVSSSGFDSVTSLDTLHFGLFVDWPEMSFFLETLESCKLESQKLYRPIVFDVGFTKQPVVVYPTGRRGGYTFHISLGDYHIFIRDKPMTEHTPNVFVEVGSVDCWTYGLEGVVSFAYKFLKATEGKIYSSKVSRVDLCADIVGCSLSSLPVSNPAHHIKRSKSFDCHYSGDSLEGVTISSGKPLMLRIYDKVRELQDKQDISKHNFFASQWGLSSLDDKPVTRVEFQFKKDVLKEFNIKTLNDLNGTFESLWKYATSKWFRLSSSPVDRKNKNQKRSENCLFWSVVQVSEWSINGVQVERNKIEPELVLEPLIKQAAGLSRTIASYFSKQATDIDGIIEVSLKLVEHELRQQFKLDFPKFSDKYYLKLSKFWRDTELCSLQ